MSFLEQDLRTKVEASKGVNAKEQKITSESDVLDKETCAIAKNVFLEALHTGCSLEKNSPVDRNILLSKNPELHYFLGWQADFYTRRSYRKFETVQHINIGVQDRKNYKALMHRLRTLQGPYSEEMRNFLNIKLQGKTLTVEEKKVFKILVNAPWFLKHVTSHYAEIQKSGNQLLSLDHRRRRGEKPRNGHTMDSEGNTDNVFFSMNPGNDFETVRFLDGVSTEIMVDHQKLMEENPTALRGTWSSGHIYAFIMEQDNEPVNIFGCQYQVHYRKEKSASNADEGWEKICTFKHPDGKEYVQTLGKGDEIFVYPRIDIAVALMAIEKFRLLGKSAWLQIMEANPKVLQDLVQVIYHSGVFEVHKPANMHLYQQGVTVLQRKPKAFNFNDNDQETIRPLIESVLNGEGDVVLKNLSAQLPLDTVVPMNNGFTLNLLAAAILTGHIPLISRLLELGVILSRNDLYIPQGQDKMGETHCVSLGLLGYVAALTRPDLLQTMVTSMTNDKIKQAVKISQDRVPTILNRLIQQGSKFKQNKNITRPLMVTAKDLMHIIYYLRPDPQMILHLMQEFQGRGEELPLVESIPLQCPELVELFIKMGAPVDECSGPISTLDDPHTVLKVKPTLPGTTPLIAAISENNLHIVKLLLKHRANPNHIFAVSSTQELLLDETPPYKLKTPEGYSPLMLAIVGGNLDIVNALLKAGADITHRSPQGKTAVSIANERKHLDILAALKAQIVINIASSMRVKMRSQSQVIRRYPLHIAAKNQDWSACETLIASGVNDLEMNQQGMSAYDLAPELLKQPFIPVQRRAEGHQAAVHMARIIITGHDDKGNRFFALYQHDNEDETLKHFLPFIGMPLQGFSRRYVVETMSETVNLKESDIGLTWTHMGALSASLLNKSFHYVDSLEVCELDFETSKKILAYPSAEKTFIYDYQLKQYYNQKEKTKPIKHQSIKISEIILQLLMCIVQKKNIAPLTREENNYLDKLYFEYRFSAHQLLDAARTGDIKKIDEILCTSDLSANQAVPTLSEVPYARDIGFLDQFYGRNDVVLRAALFADREEAALHLVQQHGAVFPRVCSEITLQKLIELGNPILFKTYLTVLEQMNLNISQLIEPHILSMLRQSKAELLDYLVSQKLINKTFEDLIIEAVYCLSYKIVQAFLPKVKNMDKFSEKLSLYALFLTYGGENFPGSNLSHDHLTNLEQNEAALIIAKIIIPYHKEKTLNVVAVRKWVSVAMDKGNVALANELLLAAPKAAQESSKDSNHTEQSSIIQEAESVKEMDGIDLSGEMEPLIFSRSTVKHDLKGNTAEHWKKALDTLDQEKIASLLEHHKEDLKNKNLIRHPRVFPESSILEYICHTTGDLELDWMPEYQEINLAWNGQDKVILEIATQLLENGAVFSASECQWALTQTRMRQSPLQKALLALITNVPTEKSVVSLQIT